MDKDGVSVIVPVYNGEEYLKECLESIINQTFKPIEIIIVNDGSYDNSLEIIKEYMKIDNRIKLVNKENGGLAAARNSGIKEAKCKYILFVDADDFIDKNTIKYLYDKAEREELDVVIFDMFIYYNNENKKLYKDIDIPDNKIKDNIEYLIDFFLGKGIGSVANKLWKTELYHSNSILYPENISYGEDSSTMPRLISKAKRIGKINKPLYYYRQNEKSMTHKKDKRIYEYILAYNIVIDYLKRDEFEKLKKYKFTFKYNLVYRHLEDVFFWSKIVKENKDYNKVYHEFKKDIKNKDNIYIKDSTKLSIINSIIVKAYKINFFIGEFVKYNIYIIIKIKRLL